jgi:amino acid adenylation domain-containing protein
MISYDINIDDQALEDMRIRSRFSSTDFTDREIEKAIPARFEKQALNHANRFAVRTGGLEVTYDELNRRANRIARAVIGKCKQKVDRVALLFTHDAAALITMIGILKSGKVYVPIDLSNPFARINFILENAEVDLIATDSQTVEQVLSLADKSIQVLNIDELDEGLPDDNLDIPIEADSFAYILYTSGSTGKPKGVVQTHRNLLHQIRSYTNKIGITPSDRLSLIPSFSVGAAHVDIYSALLNGAALCPFNIKEEGIHQLVEWLINEQITVYHSVPTLFRHILNDLPEERIFPKLRVINLGGESVNIKDIELYRKYFAKESILVNSLACTEAGVFAQYFIDHDSDLRDRTVPAGYPTEDMKIMLLDEHGKEITDDQIGEIIIKSQYLSPGYWQNPDLTNAVFISIPDEQGTRIYHTGDLGRIRRYGLLEYIGRKDLQIKIRGYRIEIPEIEIVLQRHPKISAAAVVGHEYQDGEKHLIAYVVLRHREKLPAAEIRAYLRDTLPGYMVPSKFIFLEALPLTPNGKLDRHALNAFCQEEIRQEMSFTASQNPIEKRLTEVWSHLMKRTQVGINDDFFNIGGDSLMAIDLFCWIEKEYGKRISPAMIYQYPTIAQLAELIGNNLRSESVSWLIPMRLKGSGSPLFVISDILGSPIMYSGLLKYLNQDQTVHGIKISGNDLRGTVEDTASYYVGEITKLFPHGPYFLIGFSSGGIMALEIARIFQRMQLDVPYLAMIDTIFPSAPVKRMPLWKVIFSLSFLNNLPFWFYYFFPHWVTYYMRKATNKNYRTYYREVQDRVLTVREWLLNYQPEAYSGRVVFYKARAQGLLTTSPDKGWKNICGTLDIQVVPGNHVNMMQKPYVRFLAEKINSELRKFD